MLPNLFCFLIFYPSIYAIVFIAFLSLSYLLHGLTLCYPFISQILLPLFLLLCNNFLIKILQEQNHSKHCRQKI